LEYRYNFGKTFAEAFGLIGDVQVIAEEAKAAIDSLDHEAIFNLLTDGGKKQGIYRGEDGEVYINASYIKSGKISGIEVAGGRFSDLDAENYLKVFTADAPDVGVLSHIMAHYVGDANASIPMTAMGWMYTNGESQWFLSVLGSTILSCLLSGASVDLVRVHGIWDFSQATVIGLK
jgi:hypothetical protein